MQIYKHLRNFFPLLAISLGPLTAQKSQFASVPETITYSEALQRVIENDPRLKLSDTLAEAADGQIEQADLPPNPVIGTEIENFLGTGPITGVQGLEVTLGVSQLIETADKQKMRTTLAKTERDLIDWHREIIIAELEATVRAAFVETLLAQESVNLRKEQLELARESEVETSRLVEAARSPQVELSRATLSVRQQQFALDKALRELQTSKVVLRTLWGESGDLSFLVEGHVVLEPELPDFFTLASRLPNTAQLAQYEALLRRREAGLELEQARAIPDFEIFAGGRYFNEDDGNFGFVAGFEVPWPLFDKNQGNIRTARAQVRAVEYEREVTRREVLIELNKTYQKLANAHAEALSVQSDLLPSAQQTLTDASAGYERGQYTQHAVLESRETLFEVREAYLDALQRYAFARAKIEALTRPATLKR